MEVSGQNCAPATIIPGQQPDVRIKKKWDSVGTRGTVKTLEKGIIFCTYRKRGNNKPQIIKKKPHKIHHHASFLDSKVNGASVAVVS